MNLIYPAISTILDILRITFMHPFDEKRLCATRFLSQPRVLIRYWMECQQMRWKGSDAIQLSCQLSTNIPCTTNFYSAWRTVLIIALVNEAHDTMSSVTSSSRLIVVLMDGGAKGLVLLLAFAYRHCTKLYRCSGDHERTFPIEVELLSWSLPAVKDCRTSARAWQHVDSITLHNNDPPLSFHQKTPSVQFTTR